MKRQISITIILSVIFFFYPFQRTNALAENAIRITISAQDKLDIERIREYLERIKTLKGRFLQIASNGETKSGKVFISRPGKMRFEYNLPEQILIIADGLFLIYIDKYLDQVTHVLLKNTPVSFLIRKNIEFTGEITLTNFERSPGVLQVTVQKTTEPESGSITLLFSDNPILLKKWKVIDAQNIETTVNFSDLQTGIELDPNLFIYTTIRKELP